MRAVPILLFLCSPAIAAPVPKELKVARPPNNEDCPDQRWLWPADGQGMLEPVKISGSLVSPVMSRSDRDALVEMYNTFKRRPAN